MLHDDTVKYLARPGLVNPSLLLQPSFTSSQAIPGSHEDTVKHLAGPGFVASPLLLPQLSFLQATRMLHSDTVKNLWTCIC